MKKVILHFITLSLLLVSHPAVAQALVTIPAKAERFQWCLRAQAGNTYGAANLLDGKASTCFAFNYTQVPVDCDQWMGPVFVFPTKRELCEVQIVNGYAKTQTAWERNGRVRGIMLYDADKGYPDSEMEEEGGLDSVIYIGTLADTSQPQTIKLDRPVKVKRVGIAFYSGEHFAFYPGSKYEYDVCMTSIKFLGH